MPATPDDPTRREHLIGLAAVLGSIAASLVHLYFDPLPNPDAVTYLLAAQAWLDDGYAAAALIYPSPYYSGAIAALRAMTGWSLLACAHCLDAATLAVLAVALQRLGRAAGGSARVQAIIVALVVLLPELNGYRSFLLRDFGYWALSTVALVALVRFAIAPDFRWAATFAAAAGVAAMFRAEAIALLLCVPAALLFLPDRRRFAAMLYAPVLAIGVGAGVVAVAAPATAMGRGIAQLAHKCAALLSDIPVRVQAQWRGFAEGVLDPRFHDYAGFGVAGGLATMVVVHVVIAASIPLFAIAYIGGLRGSLERIDAHARPLLGTALGVAIIGVAAALAARGIIQTRYAVSAALLIVVVAAFVIDDALTRATRPQSRRRLTAALALLVGYFVVEDAYGLVNSKQHYLRAADWIAQNTDRNARIFSNDARIVYLAGRRVDPSTVDARLRPASVPAASAQYDYIVVLQPRAHTQDDGDRSAGLDGVARFEGRKGEVVAIYRVAPTTARSGAP